MPQRPQLSRSVWTSAQRVPQAIVPVGHSARRQRPAVHENPCEQVARHAPQLALSLERSTQRSRHADSPAGQPVRQMPATQSWPAPQGRLQPPQCRRLFVTLAQTAPAPAGSSQRVAPVGHVTTQAPSAQSVPAAHAVPHAPQLAWLVCRSTHWPPQKVWSSPQGERHRPETQRSPVPHAVPQAPQLRASDETSAHAAPHAVWGGLQVSPPLLSDEQLTRAPRATPAARSRHQRTIT